MPILKLLKRLIGLGSLFLIMSIASCERVRMMDETIRIVDSLNHRAYDLRYKNLLKSEQLAIEALKNAEDYSSGKAFALNNWAFCCFMQMDFEKSDSLFHEVYHVTSNELEFLIADIGMMKICQRTAQNKEFYDFRNSAMRRIKRIVQDDLIITNSDIRKRFCYARSEFAITSSIYYYYLQQEQQSINAIREFDVEKESEKDMSQLLYYYYMKGAAQLCEAETPDKKLIEEFDYLMDCLTLSHEYGYIYFEANAMQALAEMLKTKDNYDCLVLNRPGMMRVINQRNLAWEEFPIRLAENALELFGEYGDWYQMAVTNRTLASCYAELGKYEESLQYLTEALSYVNMHHEKYYHCTDTADRLLPYIPMATNSIELEWINTEGIMTVPEWIARFREQLSLVYSALGLKPQSDYNRNIYLDILDYTRQDKELESRYAVLKDETFQLNLLLSFVVIAFFCLIVLLWIFNQRWRIRNAIYTDKLKTILDICREITTSVPTDAEDMADVVETVWMKVKYRLLALVGASDMEIVVSDEYSKLSNENCVLCLSLEASNKERLAEWRIYATTALKKEDKVLLQIVAPYISWTIENGLGLVTLGDEYKRLEKEGYVHEQHLIENKRQNLIKKACFFIVTSVMPFIDRVVNEVHKLVSPHSLTDKTIKESRYRYIQELVTCINEYNDILALWIQMRKGSLSLNIENFELASLFEVVQKGKKSFESKGQELIVTPTDLMIKADKALTLFMINTLADNARKYTPSGGHIKIYAQEDEDYVEISVQDDGPGLSPEDVSYLLEAKVYDSGRIGISTANDIDELQKSKGSGFGLLNCKSIIEKYRKTNEIFRVCNFFIDSRIGEGSRFYFRLPKGVRKLLGVVLLCVFSFGFGCVNQQMDDDIHELDVVYGDTLLGDKWLEQANLLADKVYHANLAGNYHDALSVADSAFVCLNHYYQSNSGKINPLLTLAGEGNAAELTWFEDGFDTDYYTLLDVRNEVAVACLALNLFDAYQYNNQAYTSLYKQISKDVSLAEYCEQMELSANNKIVSIVLCVVLLLALLFGYYMLYFRHRLMYRYNLEQVFEVNQRAISIPLFGKRDKQEIASTLASGLYKEINELLAMDVLGIAVYSNELHKLCYAFSSLGEFEDEMKSEMLHCFELGEPILNKENTIRSVPLCVKVGEDVHRMGVMAFQGGAGTEREEDELLFKLVANYISIIIYNAVELVAQKYDEIEIRQDEVRRLIRENSQLHVQNLVLDNCLSTIKHETIYYPNRIKQIIEKLNQNMSETEECQQVETIADLVEYYKGLFTILSSWAARQLEETTFKRGVVSSKELSEHARRFFERQLRKLDVNLELVLKSEDVNMIGDIVLLKFLLENLILESVSYKRSGKLELHIYKEGDFVRFDFLDYRREYCREDLNQLFYPQLSRMKQKGIDGLSGTEYLICKQIIREHDEFAGRRGCRMNADSLPGGGFVVWCTIPAK